MRWPERGSVGRRLVNRMVGAGVAVPVLVWASRAAQLNLSLSFAVLVAALGALLSLAFSDELWPDPPAPAWDVKLERRRPHLPRERRAVRLADLARGADPSRRFTTAELRAELTGLVADRLVRHHDADPAHPFAGSDRLLSPALFDYLTGEEAAPTVRRAVLGAYLKEIDSL